MNEIKFPICLRDEYLGNASWSSPKLLYSEFLKQPLGAVLTQRTNSHELKVTNKTPNLPWRVCSVCYLTKKKDFTGPHWKRAFTAASDLKERNTDHCGDPGVRPLPVLFTESWWFPGAKSRLNRASSVQFHAYSTHNGLAKSYILWKGIASLSDLSDEKKWVGLKKTNLMQLLRIWGC